MQHIPSDTTWRIPVNSEDNIRLIKPKKNVYGAIGTPLEHLSSDLDFHNGFNKAKATCIPTTIRQSSPNLSGCHQMDHQYEGMLKPSKYRQSSFALFSSPYSSQQLSSRTYLESALPLRTVPSTQASTSLPWSGVVSSERRSLSTPTVYSTPRLSSQITCKDMPRLTGETAYQSEARELRPKTDNSVKLLADSLAFMSLGATKAIAARTFPVIKVSNIPWSISLSEIRELLHYVKMPPKNDLAQNIHIIINKTTGKTLADAFIEVLTEDDAAYAIRQCRHPPVKGRKLFISKSSQEQLMKDLFPEWPGKFTGGRTILPLSSGTMKTSAPPPLVQRKEFESLLAICRNFKLHFSRKCGERPFENFISLLVKFPWDQPHIITTLQRDHMYEYYKLATNVLKNHLAKPYINLDPSLMNRMIRAALQCPGLTIPQKKGILVAGGVTCPPELQHHIELPSEETSPQAGPVPHTATYAYPDTKHTPFTDLVSLSFLDDANLFTM